MPASGIKGMNLRTAALLCEHFLSSVKEGGLVDQLSEVLTKGDRLHDAVTVGSKPPKHLVDELKSAAKKARQSYDDSVFADPAMKVFPEFDQLGFGTIMGADIKDSLDAIIEGDGDDTDLASNLARIGHQGEGIPELTEQLEKLMAIADYFGVESRSTFASEAIAVLQMPQGQAGEGASGNVDAFIDRMESFQSLVDFCGVSDDAKGANIRMISGDDALMVADLTVEGAQKLQNIISDVKAARSDILEIESATERLKNVGVDEKIIDLLGEEIDLIRTFDQIKTGDFLKALIGGENGITAKWMADAVMGLVNDGVRIDSVVLRSGQGASLENSFGSDVSEVEEETTEAAQDSNDTKDEIPQGSSNKTTAETLAEDKDNSNAINTAAAGATVIEFADRGKTTEESPNPSVQAVSAEDGGSVEQPVTAKTETVSEQASDVSETLSEAPEAGRHVTLREENSSKDETDDAEKSAQAVEEKGTSEVSEPSDTRSEAEINAARARKKNLRSIWETFSNRP